MDAHLTGPCQNMADIFDLLEDDDTGQTINPNPLGADQSMVQFQQYLQSLGTFVSGGLFNPPTGQPSGQSVLSQGKPTRSGLPVPLQGFPAQGLPTQPQGHPQGQHFIGSRATQATNKVSTSPYTLTQIEVEEAVHYALEQENKPHLERLILSRRILERKLSAPNSLLPRILVSTKFALLPSMIHYIQFRTAFFEDSPFGDVMVRYHSDKLWRIAEQYFSPTLTSERANLLITHSLRISTS